MAQGTLLMQTETLLRSSSLRLSLVFSSIVVISFLATALLVEVGSERTAETQARERIELEVFALEQELTTESLEAMAAAIQARASRAGALEYWLLAPDGQHLAGSLALMQGPVGWREVEVEEEDRLEDSDLLVLTKVLPGGAQLSVGEDLTGALAAQKATLSTLMRVGAIAAILALLAGLFATYRTFLRVRSIAHTLQRASEGDLSVRAPVTTSWSASDLDDIADGLNQMLTRTQELVSGLKRVTRDIAHDLRTPLGHLRQRLERIALSEREEERNEAIHLAEAKVDQILASFDAILRLSEIESGSLRERFTTVRLDELCDALVDAYRPDVEISGRTLKLIATHAEAYGDAGLLGQAIANLIENAMRHTPPGTVITVSCRRDEAGASSLAVTDNGPGIPGAQHAAMLEPFARLDPSRAGTGTGLGLSIVAATAKLHGAQLVLSDAQPGLTVRLTFHNSCHIDKLLS